GAVRRPDAGGDAVCVASRRPPVLAHAKASLAAVPIGDAADRHLLLFRRASLSADRRGLGDHFPGAGPDRSAVGTAAGRTADAGALDRVDYRLHRRAHFVAAGLVGVPSSDAA